MKNKSTPSHYILITADVDKSLMALPSAFDVAMYRLKHKQWGFKSTTRNRRSIKINDRLLIYTAGKRENGKCFIATAEVASPVRPAANNSENVDSPVVQKAVSCDLVFDLKNIRKFRNFVSIYDVKKHLKCIKTPESIKWACVFQNGSLRISIKDYMYIFKRG